MMDLFSFVFILFPFLSILSTSGRRLVTGPGRRLVTGPALVAVLCFMVKSTVFASGGAEVLESETVDGFMVF